MPAIWTRTRSTGRKFGFQWQIEAGHSHVVNLRVFKSKFAVRTFENPFGHLSPQRVTARKLESTGRERTLAYQQVELKNNRVLQVPLCIALNRRLRPICGTSRTGRNRGFYVEENKERWKLLCEQASVEQDPEKLHTLITEINDLLEAKEDRLKGSPPKT
jgi:hypothetical protein